MITVLQAFLMTVGVVFLVLLSVLLGGWLVFKSKAGPGDRFIGPAAKGSVFSIPDAEAAPDEVDQTIDERSKEFLANILGGK